MSVAVGEHTKGDVVSMMTPNPEVHIIDVDNEFVLPQHHQFVDGGSEPSTDHPTAPSSLESEAVSQLLKQQKRLGTVAEWTPG